MHTYSHISRLTCISSFCPLRRSGRAHLVQVFVSKYHSSIKRPRASCRTTSRVGGGEMQNEPGESYSAQASVHGEAILVGILEISPVPIGNKATKACDSQVYFEIETRIGALGSLRDFEL